MPSTTGRLGTGVGPPLGDGCGSGRTCESKAHWSSVSSGWRMLMTRLRAMTHLLTPEVFYNPLRPQQVRESRL